MASSAGVEGLAAEAADAGAGLPGAGPRNPLVCPVCQDYFSEPCLLACYHTFCARCLRGPYVDGKISCPSCG